MATAATSFLPLLSFFTLILSIQAGLDLDPSDRDALLSVQKSLGVISGNRRITDLCNTTGISCERRISNVTSSYVLRVTRIVYKSWRLCGSLSPAIGRLSELRELSIPNNHLVGQIPWEIVGCVNLQVLDLRNNRFSGKVPSDLSALVRLRILDLSSNVLSGDLDFLKYFPNLEILSLADNLFTGKVPNSLRSFRNLRFLNISGNSLLEGPVPAIDHLEYSSLRQVGKRTGDKALPKRYVFAETNSTAKSRPQTAAMPPSAAAEPPVAAKPPAAAPHNHKKSSRKIRGWILGFLAGALAGIISGIIFTVLFKLVMVMIKGRRNENGLAIFSPLIKADELAFLEKEDGLSEMTPIGQGGCGVVYKVDLPENGKIKTIAIKKIVQPPRDAAELTEEDTKLLNKKMRQIKSEIQTVGKIRHRNLLPLLAHVSRPDSHYLVYEFMENGSLQDILHQVSLGNHVLDWPARHKIALGVASGLEYLHTSQSPPIIHRDLKPANVLLDNDMEARIADFGLAKAIPEDNTHMTSSNVAGTLGYIAPEYHQTMKFTEKCDIYSFGVLLGVLVVGKLPSDEYFQHTDEMQLVKWMRNVMTSEDPKKAIDPKLLGDGYEEQMLLVLKIACFCTLDSPKERPNSRDVRIMLAQIKK